MLFAFLLTGTNWHSNRTEGRYGLTLSYARSRTDTTESGAHDHAMLMSIIKTYRMRGLTFDYAMEYVAGRL